MSLTVCVVLMNDDGDTEEIFSSGDTVDDAIWFAEEAVREASGDDSYVMDSWAAA